VPLNGVEDVYCELQVEKPDYPQLDGWSDYVLETYKEKNDPRKPYFDKTLWNHYDSDTRTNNDVEGYNLKLPTVMKFYPNIWVFITKLKAEESVASLKYIRTRNNTLIGNKRNEIERNEIDIQRDLNIQNAKVELLTQKIDIMEYVNKVSNVVMDFEDIKNEFM
jgi:hypothetical protein